MAATETSLTLPAIAKKISVYQNGDEKFPGKKLTVNKRKIPNFDTFLDHVTEHLKPRFGAVRRLYTPTNGHRITDLDQVLKRGENYVAAGQEKFHRLDYLEIEVSPRKRANKGGLNIKPVRHSRIQTSGRIRKIRTEPIIIFVHPNGNDLEGPHRIQLRPREQGSWEMVLDAIKERVSLRWGGAIRRLCTIDGQPLHNVHEIENSGCYVACGSERFVQKDYEHPKAVMHSPRQDRRSYQHGMKLTPISQRTSKKGSQNSSVNRTPESNNGSVNSRPRKARRNQVKKEDPVIYEKPVAYKRNGKKEPDYDEDPGGVFKAHKENRETRGAVEITEDRETRVDVPVDQRRAEVVEEELIESERLSPTLKHTPEPPKTYQRESSIADSHNSRQSARSRRSIPRHTPEIDAHTEDPEPLSENLDSGLGFEQLEKEPGNDMSKTAEGLVTGIIEKSFTELKKSKPREGTSDNLKGNTSRGSSQQHHHVSHQQQKQSNSPERKHPRENERKGERKQYVQEDRDRASQTVDSDRTDGPTNKSRQRSFVKDQVTEDTASVNDQQPAKQQEEPTNHDSSRRGSQFGPQLPEHISSRRGSQIGPQLPEFESELDTVPNTSSRRGSQFGPQYEAQGSRRGSQVGPEYESQGSTRGSQVGPEYESQGSRRGSVVGPELNDDEDIPPKQANGKKLSRSLQERIRRSSMRSSQAQSVVTDQLDFDNQEESSGPFDQDNLPPSTKREEQIVDQTDRGNERDHRNEASPPPRKQTPSPVPSPVPSPTNQETHDQPRGGNSPVAELERSPSPAPKEQLRISTPADVTEEEVHGNEVGNHEEADRNEVENHQDEKAEEGATTTADDDDATPREGNENKRQTENPGDEETAAIVIQSRYRGYRVRRDQQKKQNHAATVIQSNYRGYKTRRQLKQYDS